MNQDEINCLRAKTNPSKGGHVARHEPHIQGIKGENISFWRKRSHISDLSNVEREREGGRFPSAIHGILSVGIHRAKS